MAKTCIFSNFKLSQPGIRKLTISRGNTNLNVSNGLSVIPGDDKDVVIGVDRMFTTPLYWSLPKIFKGDKVNLNFILNLIRIYNGLYFR